MTAFANPALQQARGQEKVLVIVRGGDGRCENPRKCFAYSAIVPGAAYRAGSYLEKLEPTRIRDVFGFVRGAPPQVGCIALSGFPPEIQSGMERVFHTRGAWQPGVMAEGIIRGDGKAAAHKGD